MTAGEVPNGIGARKIALVLFDGVAELDVIGPWEVFASWTRSHPEDGWAADLNSPDGAAVRCAKGATLAGQEPWDTIGGADVVVIPGGQGARGLAADPRTPSLVCRWTDGAEIVASVCTGALLLAVAGKLNGRPVTTHHLGRDLLAQHIEYDYWPAGRGAVERTR